MTAHDDLEQVLGGSDRPLAHSEIVDDEQRGVGEVGDVVFARAERCALLRPCGPRNWLDKREIGRQSRGIVSTVGNLQRSDH